MSHLRFQRAMQIFQTRD